MLKLFHLTIAGGTVGKHDLKYFHSLQDAVRLHRLNETISFSGYLNTEAIPDFIGSLDLMVLPYRESGSGSASGPLMLARSLGVPVLASDSRNFSETITHGLNGLLFFAKSGASGIMINLKAFISNKNLRETLKLGAINISEEASWRNTANRLEKIFPK